MNIPQFSHLIICAEVALRVPAVERCRDRGDRRRLTRRSATYARMQ